MKIIIDADACPKGALQACFSLGKKYGVQVWTVASFEHNVKSDHHVVVGNSPQEADIKVMNISRPGDIAVTQDYGLAAALLGRGVKCLSPGGREYNNATIDFMLEERNLKFRHRRGGGKTKGPAKRTQQDDFRFQSSLERMLQGEDDD